METCENPEAEPESHPPQAIECVNANANASNINININMKTKIKSKGGPYYCYIIANGTRTYNGYTNNLQRRLRQHNGELRGGARATHNRGQGWQYIAIMTSVTWTAKRAMQCEWTLKYPTRKRPRPKEFNGPNGRIASLIEAIKHIPELVTISINKNYENTIRSLQLPETVTIEVMDP